MLSCSRRCLLFLLLSLSVSSVSLRGAGVIVNEIMYHPASTNRLEEWFELHNASAESVDLSGWRTSQGVTFTFPAGTRLAAGGYLVVAADVPTFAAGHPGIGNVVGGWTGVLSHDGEDLEIEDAEGNAADHVAYAPEGEWAVRRLGPVDRLNRRGWEWYAEHGGLGKSLELVNSELPNELGQNWGSSSVAGGTPGGPNSIASDNMAPLILDVAHAPVVPRSSDPVTVTARLMDEQAGGREVMVHWRLDGAPEFAVAPMVDDGAHGDGLEGDGLYGAILPPQASRTIVEFYLTARDAEGHARRYPNVEPSGGARTADLAYQVDDSVYAGDQALFRLIMTAAEYDYLSSEIWGGEPRSDAAVNGTFISTDGILDGGSTTHLRYQCDFRNRGHGTRTTVPHNFHVGFAEDRAWKGRFGINLNTHYTHSQHLGSAVFRRAGVAAADS
ncbi:MAG TPA: lamin tail domain-containing protein, partial [Verrucomicrobiota bacterium]|nr:lamin tail domain-containing protein [Verrucomicrobiota bacterium]